MIQDIIIPFMAIMLAELGDKTQLALLCLSTKTKKRVTLLLGAILAFALVDGVAIIFGDLLVNIVPIRYIKIIAGTIFMIFGIILLIKKDETESKCELKRPFFSAFGIILISELGDKTQIASGLFATQFNPLFVFVSIMFALSILSIITIYAGNLLFKRINKKVVSVFAGSIFIIMGILTLI